MADRNIIIEDDKGNRYFPYTKAELVEGAETPSGAQAKADTAESNAKSYAKSYTDQQVATKADIDHKHSAADITSGTIAVERLPAASTIASGVVKLTTSRTSASTTLALTASAMNDHRNSGDHDGRYYTKEQVDALVGSGGTRWMVPGNTTLVTGSPPSGAPEWSILSSELWSGVVSFKVEHPGRYRISGNIRAYSSSHNGGVAVCTPGWTGGALFPDVYTPLGPDDKPLPPGLGLASPVFLTSSMTGVSFTLDMFVPAAAGGSVVLVAYACHIGTVSLKAVEGPPTPTMAWAGSF